MMRVVLFLLAVSMGIFAGPAAADAIRVWNCTSRSNLIKTYNALDAACFFPTGTRVVEACGGPAIFECAGGCKIKAEGSVVGGGGCQFGGSFKGDWIITKIEQVHTGYFTKLGWLKHKLSDHEDYVTHVQYCDCRKEDMDINW